MRDRDLQLRRANQAAEDAQQALEDYKAAIANSGADLEAEVARPPTISPVPRPLAWTSAPRRRRPGAAAQPREISS